MPAVLIVEDSENSRAMLEIAFLGIPDLSVLMVPSAVEALRMLDMAVRGGTGDGHGPEYAAHGRVRVNPPGAGGPKALGYAYHRNKRRYRPGNSGADCGVGSGSILSETVFAGAGAPETGATSQWQDALV